MLTFLDDVYWTIATRLLETCFERKSIPGRGRWNGLFEGRHKLLNYLAHLFLSAETDEAWLGSLAGDFVRGKIIGSDDYSRAIRHHRAVDAFTDTHQSVAAMRRIVAVEHGHYSRVIVDMFLDHFLAREWERYSAEPLEAFTDRALAGVCRVIERAPAPLQRIAPRMRAEGWLLSYRQVPGIETALRNMSRRVSRPVRLDTAVDVLIRARAELQGHFEAFMPELIDRWKSR